MVKGEKGSSSRKPADRPRTAARRRPPREAQRRPLPGRGGRPGRKPIARRRLPDRAAVVARAKRARTAARPAAATLAARITAFGERSSRVIRAAAAPVVAGLVSLALLGRKGLARLAVVLTPLRAVIAVTGIAAVLLAVSQFVDYRGVSVGVDNYSAYSDVQAVAPPPQVDRKPTGSAHSYLLLPVAAAALALLVACARGHWRLGRLISLLGLAALAVSVLIDVPIGLDEGEQAIAYAGVEAQLVEGFYVQVVSAAVLVVGGLLVSRYARPARRRTRTRRREAGVRRLGARTA